MKPEADQILNVSADQLMAAAMAGIDDAYGRGTAAIHALLLKFVAREYERGAAIRAAENRDMRALFLALAPQIRDSALRAASGKAAKSQDEELSISSLNAANVEMRLLLIALQAHVEETGARAAQSQIWELLKSMASRRLVSLF